MGTVSVVSALCYYIIYDNSLWIDFTFIDAINHFFRINTNNFLMVTVAITRVHY